MECERCGGEITSTHFCTPTRAYLERKIVKLERRIDLLEQAVEDLRQGKRPAIPDSASQGIG